MLDQVKQSQCDTKDNNDFLHFFWATIIVIASAIVTYYVALAWALLKPICGYVLINYIIQGAVNAIMLILGVAHLEAYGRERCSEE